MDVSAQDALAIVNLQNQQYWNLAKFNPKRAGSAQMLSGVRWSRQKRLWKCRDGFVIFIISSGHMGAPGNKALTEWMASEGLAPEFMQKINWDTFDPQGHELTDEQYREMQTAIGDFFQRHSKAELYEGSVQKRIVLYPCNTTEDLMHDAQLLRCPSDRDVSERVRAWQLSPRGPNPYLYSYSLTSVVEDRNHGMGSVYQGGLPPLHFKAAYIKNPSRKIMLVDENGDADICRPLALDTIDDGRWVPFVE